MQFVNNEFFESQNMPQVVATRDSTAPTRGARDTVLGVLVTRDTGVVTRERYTSSSSY